MKNFSKLSAEIKSAIQKSHNILLTLHPGPDPDSLGANLAMYLWLKSIGKNPTLIKGDSELKTQATVFPEYDSITKKNITEINISDYDLFISMDSSSKEQISKLLDVSPLLKKIKFIILDHHSHNTLVSPLKIASPKYAAACEIIYDLFEKWHVTITQDIAICLYFGIFFDTGAFVNSNVTSEVFIKCGHLVKKIKNLYKYVSIYNYHRQPEEFTYTRVALENIQTFFNNQVAISGISLNDLEKNNLTPAQASKNSISEFLRTCADWQISICLVETEPNKCEVSMRSHAPEFDVSQVARNLGGGGHVVAAGITIRTDLPTAIQMIVAEIAKVCPQLGKA
jgi:phosphoesterase RecJ-like protein